MKCDEKSEEVEVQPFSVSRENVRRDLNSEKVFSEVTLKKQTPTPEKISVVSRRNLLSGLFFFKKRK